MSEQQQPTTALAPFEARARELRENIGDGEPVAIVPRTFAEVQAFALAISKSSLVPKALQDNAADVAMMILAGAEIRVPPIASLRVFHVIEGVPKLSADGIAAICMRDASCEYIEPVEQSATRVTWAAKKRNRPEVRLTLTREDMQLAGLYERKNRDGSPGNHQKYPRQMLNARCKAELCRMVWPSICAGMLSAEEARDIDDAIDAEFVDHKSTSFEPPPSTKQSTPPPSSAPVANEEQATTAPSPTTASAGPLTDDDVANIADEMKLAATNKDDAELKQIAADVSKLNINKAQREYLLGVYRKSSDAIKAAA